MTNLFELLQTQKRLSEISKHDEEAEIMDGSAGPRAGGRPIISSFTKKQLVDAMREGDREFHFESIDLGRYKNELTLGGAGQILIDRNIVLALELSKGNFSIVRKLATIIPRPMPGPMGIAQTTIPLLGNQSVEAAIIPAGSKNPTDTATSFSGAVLSGLNFATPRKRITRALEEDAPQLVASQFAIAGGELGRGMNRAYTVGVAGSGTEGLLAAVPVAVTTSSPTAMALTEVQSLEGAVPEPYLLNSSFMASSAVKTYLMKMADGSGRPVWRAAGLDKYPFHLNDHMPGMTAGQSVLLFGDFSMYAIVDFGPVRINILKEAYAEFVEDAFEAWQYSCGALADPSGKAIQALALHS